jgi:2'-5' RNA ligase
VNLFAALVPPAEALDRVRVLAAGVAPVPERVVASGPPGRHRLGRRRPPESPVSTGPMLDLLPTVQMHVPIAKFGNLALNDAMRLADAMESDATTWETPRLGLAGALALEPEGDPSVWVKLAGDLDALHAVSQGIARVAKRLHLFVDRRAFRPHVQLGTVNDDTTAGYLEELLAVLEDFESDLWWQTTFLLVSPAEAGPDRPPYRPYRDVRLGPAVAH